MGSFCVTWEMNPRAVAPATRRYVEAEREMLLALALEHHGLAAEVLQGEAQTEDRNEEAGASPPASEVTVRITGDGVGLWRLARDLALMGWRRPHTRGLPPAFDLRGRGTGAPASPADALALAEDDALDEVAFGFVGVRRQEMLDLRDQ